jgi:IS4 transposase
MLLGNVFERFASYSPVSVMMRGILTHALPAKRIDELFRQHAARQYEDELLFSTCVNILGLAVSGSRRSVNAAYRASRDEIEVSVTSLYNKLKGTESAVSQALVRETAQRLEPLIRQLQATQAPRLPGYRLRILDGNHLAGTEHRLKETRKLNSSPLPGQALVVLDPELMLMVDVFPCADAYAQERSLLLAVLETVQANDVWLADRNFCTTGFLFGLKRRSAFFVIRQHASTLSGKRLVGKRKAAGRCAAGKLYEQTLLLDDPETGEQLTVRRITLVLDECTVDGETEIHILTNLPAEVADTRSIAEMYRGRWTIENAFQELDQALASEMNTLCYPQAALLCFCVGVCTYNVLSAVKAGFRAVHGDAAALHKLSGYYLAEEIAAAYHGMMIAIAPKHWAKAFANLTTAELVSIIKQLAKNVHLAQFLKNSRGPKKPPPQRTGGLREKHVSTARLLEQRTLVTSSK